VRQVGPYRLEEEVAHGGAGVVYQARAPDGRLVAVKLLSRTLSTAARKRFEREVAALSRLEHPNLVGILEASAESGVPYMVLEWVPGDSVQAHLNRHGTFEPARALELTLTLARALCYVHEQGLLHRDLKPDNVLVAHDGEPRLADFGLVKDTESALSQLTQTGALQGTPGFWAPEQAAGEIGRQGPATDIYGLGATLYAMLTGVPPAQGASLNEILTATLEQAPAKPSSLNPAVSRQLDAICLRCLRKEPDDRYASAAELVADLEAAQLGGAPNRPRGVARVVVWLGLLVLGAAALVGSRSQATRARAALRQVERARLNARALVMRARTRLRYDAVHEGLADAEEAIGLAPDLPGAYLTRALALGNLGRHEDALADFNRALELDPGMFYGHNARGYTKQVLGDLRGAAEDYERAIALRPGFGLAYLNRGGLKLAAGDVKAALQDFESAKSARL
jgi:tetratricopeptide (TPR) repeat protein